MTRAFDQEAIALLSDLDVDIEKVAEAFEAELEKVAIFGLLARGGRAAAHAVASGAGNATRIGGNAIGAASRASQGAAEGIFQGVTAFGAKAAALPGKAVGAVGDAMGSAKGGLSSSFNAGLAGRTGAQQGAAGRLGGMAQGPVAPVVGAGAPGSRLNQVAAQKTQARLGAGDKIMGAPAKPPPVATTSPPPGAAAPNAQLATASPNATPPAPPAAMQTAPPPTSTPAAGSPAGATGASTAATAPVNPAAAAPTAPKGMLETNFGVSPENVAALKARFAEGGNGFAGGQAAMGDWWAKLGPEQKKNILGASMGGAATVGVAGGYAAGSGGR